MADSSEVSTPMEAFETTELPSEEATDVIQVEPEKKSRKTNSCFLHSRFHRAFSSYFRFMHY